jgi:sugar fermentation stimulation protein A
MQNNLAVCEPDSHFSMLSAGIAVGGPGNRRSGMKFRGRLAPGRLVRRYKRFLADVRLADGSAVTAHCPNTGAMLGCQAPDSRVWLSRSDRPHRKYEFTWELVETAPGVRVGINTARSNGLVREALESNLIPEFRGYQDFHGEVTLGPGSSRIDFLLTGPRVTPCYLEVKNVTAAVDAGIAVFPDAVSTRARRHVEELQQLSSQGWRAALLFCVQREDVHTVRPAEEIDPLYATALRRAASRGVQVLAYGARVGLREIALEKRLSCGW